MGSDAQIFVFDYERYVGEIVPAFRKLLLTGEAVPWLREVIDDCEKFFQEALRFDLTLLRHTDIARNCTYLTANFAFAAGRTNLKRNNADFADWEERVCRSPICPDRVWCPFHTSAPQVVTETLNLVLLEAIEKKCLETSQFVGRTYRPSIYKGLLDSFEISEIDRGRLLLDQLGMRGFVVGYTWAGSGEGIHGWLAPDETYELRDFLDSLPLPRYEPTIENMQAMHEAIQSRQTEQSVSWDEISLSFVRTIATIAVGKQKGVLWGNDVMSQPYCSIP